MTICDHPASSGSFPTGTFPARLITGLLSIPSFNLAKPTQSRLCPSMMVQISSCANSAMPWADHCPVARSCFFDRDVRLAILSCPEPSIPHGRVVPLTGIDTGHDGSLRSAGWFSWVLCPGVSTAVFQKDEEDVFLVRVFQLES
jgi:hypothetical protein